MSWGRRQELKPQMLVEREVERSAQWGVLKRVVVAYGVTGVALGWARSPHNPGRKRPDKPQVATLSWS